MKECSTDCLISKTCLVVVENETSKEDIRPFQCSLYFVPLREDIPVAENLNQEGDVRFG